MALEVGRDIMMLKGMQGYIDSKTEVIVSKEWKAEEGSNRGTDLGTELGGRRGWSCGVGTMAPGSDFRGPGTECRGRP